MKIISLNLEAPKAEIRVDYLDGLQPHEREPNFYVRGNPTYGVKNSAIPAAYAAINLLASSLAGLPVMIRQDKHVDVEEHPLNDLILQPSRMFDAWQFWESFMYNPLFKFGNAYAWIRRDNRTYRPIELVPARVWRAEWRPGRYGPQQRYDLELIGSQGQYTFSTETRRITAMGRDVLSFHGPGYDGLFSPSPIAYAASQILHTMNNVYRHQNAVLENGMNSNFALTLDKELVVSGKIKPKDVSDLIARIKTEYAGARNAGETPVLPPGVGVEDMSAISSLDLQIIDLLKWGLEDIARVFGISPLRLGHNVDKARVRTFEQQATDFERYTIYQHTRRAMAQMNMKLRVRADVDARYRFAMPTSALQQGTFSERATAVDTVVARAGVLTINEGRDILERAPRPDGDRLVSPKGAPAQGPTVQGDDDDDE